jgi:VWFA-related protein
MSVEAMLVALVLVLARSHADTGSARIARVSTAEYPIVRCFVDVWNGAGEPVAGLAAGDFEVRQNGAPRAFSVYSLLQRKERLALVIAIDRSKSMKKIWTEVQSAASDFVARVSRPAAIGLVSFAETAEVNCPLTPLRDEVKASLQTLRPDGKTALYDGVLLGLRLLKAAKAERRALVLLTDGWESGGALKESDGLGAARAAGVPVYILGLGRVNAGALRRLADASGGAFFSAPAPQDLASVYQRIAQRLAMQYVVSFRNDDVPLGASPRLTVRVRVDGDWQERARTYLALRRTVAPAAPVPPWAPFVDQWGALGIIGLGVLDLALWTALQGKRRGRRRWTARRAVAA